MISALQLDNFKCFESLTLPLSRMTLLTGFNAAGKSTSLQTLLLLAQTLRSDERGLGLRLNGPLVRLGDPGDVINQRRGGNRIALGIETPDVAIRWELEAHEGNARRTLRVVGLRITAEQAINDFSVDELHRLLPADCDFAGKDLASAAIAHLDEVIFVSALRQVSSEVFSSPDDTEPNNGDVGALGEYSAWWFHHLDDMEIPQRRCVDGVARTLRAQVNAWIGEFFPGAQVDVQPVPDTGLVRLCFRTSRNQGWQRPSNIGYGLSYAFPLIVAGLCASQNQLLVIDSPEAHLHPQGQSRMGQFLSQVSSSGPQLIVETHSDHVLNGIRLALRDGISTPEDVTIHFFGSPIATESTMPPVTTVSGDKNGNLSGWPPGFFDQAEKDLANLAGWK